MANMWDETKPFEYKIKKKMLRNMICINILKHKLNVSAFFSQIVAYLCISYDYINRAHSRSKDYVLIYKIKMQYSLC